MPMKQLRVCCVCNRYVCRGNGNRVSPSFLRIQRNRTHLRLLCMNKQGVRTSHISQVSLRSPDFGSIGDYPEERILTTVKQNRCSECDTNDAARRGLGRYSDECQGGGPFFRLYPQSPARVDGYVYGRGKSDTPYKWPFHIRSFFENHFDEINLFQ